MTVGTGTVTVSATYTGSVDYANYQNLSFAADGNVGTVNVKVGDLVKKGQVLASSGPDSLGPIHTEFNANIAKCTAYLDN